MSEPTNGPPTGRPLRIAFLTPEYPTERTGRGGVGSYVDKMAHALVTRGHDCTVFVTSRQEGETDHGGVRVVRVGATRSPWRRALARLLRPLDPQAYVFLDIANAKRLADALERDHAKRPFDVVQSANYRGTGQFVRPRPERRHLVRISTSRLLYLPAYGRSITPLARLIERIDVRIQRSADASYAPSDFLRRYFRDTYGLDVRLVRPPTPVDTLVVGDAPDDLPPRYLVHFGSLGKRKGTDVVAAALPLAWDEAPDLAMVWAGPIDDEAGDEFRASFGDRASHVRMLGPLDKPALYAVVKNAEASVLPSRMDNLPNTVIESLALGTPVIGSDGASIDELVTPGVNGALAPIGDEVALAREMVAAWNGTAPWSKAGNARIRLPDAMHPDAAVAAFLELATARTEPANQATPERT